MADREGDKEKQPGGDCGEHSTTCRNIKCTYEGHESETWSCETCGASYTLYDDEMR